MTIQGVIRGLFPINCYYNQNIKEDGKCYSSECMSNQDKNIKEKIQTEGCKIHEKVKKEGGGIWMTR